MIILLITFALVFGLLVFVHEFGHFIMAKRAGVKVEEFGFGFPPKLFGIKRGETLYTINLIPLGGFVKLYGEGGESTGDPKSFSHLKVGKRAKIVLAGVVMNFILAVILFISVNLYGAPYVTFDKPEVPAGTTVVEEFKIIVADVEKDSPADKAGIKASDQLVSGNGVEFDSAESVSKFTTENAGKEVKLKIKKDGSESELTVTLRDLSDESQGALGVQPIGIMRVRYALFPALEKGVTDTGTIFLAIILGIVKLIVAIFTAERAAEGVAGPVGIGVLLNQFIKLGPAYVLNFMAVLSVTLSVFNTLPIPALDGGRFLFLVIEKFRGKRVKPEVENLVHTVGFAVLLVLILLVTIGDIRKLF